MKALPAPYYSLRNKYWNFFFQMLAVIYGSHM